jgi:hypothetical protein
LEQTRQAIRKNWKFLEFANLQRTDLSGIGLYVADLRGAAFAGAKFDGAKFRCANLEDTRFDEAEISKNSSGILEFRLGTAVAVPPDVEYVNVHGLTPKSFHDWAVSTGKAVDLPDETWRKTRLQEPNCFEWRQVEPQAK